MDCDSVFVCCQCEYVTLSFPALSNAAVIEPSFTPITLASTSQAAWTSFVWLAASITGSLQQVFTCHHKLLVDIASAMFKYHRIFQTFFLSLYSALPHTQKCEHVSHQCGQWWGLAWRMHRWESSNLWQDALFIRWDISVVFRIVDLLSSSSADSTGSSSLVLLALRVHCPLLSLSLPSAGSRMWSGLVGCACWTRLSLSSTSLISTKECQEECLVQSRQL